MPEKEKNLFYKYLDKSNYYFEFGSGGSTYQALIRTNIKSIYSIENHEPYYKNLLDQLKKDSRRKNGCGAKANLEFTKT